MKRPHNLLVLLAFAFEEGAFDHAPEVVEGFSAQDKVRSKAGLYDLELEYVLFFDMFDIYIHRINISFLR